MGGGAEILTNRPRMRAQPRFDVPCCMAPSRPAPRATQTRGADKHTKPAKKQARELVIVTGISGAGKASALKAFEDLGFHAVDNLPLELLPDFASLICKSLEVESAAIVVDIREGQTLDRFPEILKQVKKLLPTRVVFLDAQDAVLVRRFSETRRPHPLGRSETVSRSIVEERQLLDPVRDVTDTLIDTSNFNVHELRAHIQARFGHKDETRQLLVSCLSFGFKNGVPLDADMVFDVRFLPNPLFVPEFRKKTGRDRKVVEYIMRVSAGNGVSGPGDGADALPAAALRQGGEKLPERGLRLHRRPAPQRDDGRRDAQTAQEGRLLRKGAAPGYSAVMKLVHHPGHFLWLPTSF
jgi:UPF0042 nucleotide-binding protein